MPRRRPALVVVVAVAGAAPQPFELTFDGSHPAEVHEGPFTASAPFCTAGYAADFDVVSGPVPPTTVKRRHTCGDGSGSIVLRVNDPHAEHEPGGKGTWKILEGSGGFAQLRGRGTWTSSGGERFRNVFTGIVDFDTSAPQVGLTRATAVKLRRPKGAYLVRASLFARDDEEGNVVSYQLTVLAGGLQLGAKSGETTSGQVSAALRVRPPARSRRLRLELSASDPLGNERTIARSLKLRR